MTLPDQVTLGIWLGEAWIPGSLGAGPTIGAAMAKRLHPRLVAALREDGAHPVSLVDSLRARLAEAEETANQALEREHAAEAKAAEVCAMAWEDRDDANAELTTVTADRDRLTLAVEELTRELEGLRRVKDRRAEVVVPSQARGGAFGAVPVLVTDRDVKPDNIPPAPTYAEAAAADQTRTPVVVSDSESTFADLMAMRRADRLIPLTAERLEAAMLQSGWSAGEHLRKLAAELVSHLTGTGVPAAPATELAPITRAEWDAMRARVGAGHEPAPALRSPRESREAEVERLNERIRVLESRAARPRPRSPEQHEIDKLRRRCRDRGRHLEQLAAKLHGWNEAMLAAVKHAGIEWRHIQADPLYPPGIYPSHLAELVQILLDRARPNMAVRELDKPTTTGGDR